MWHLNYFCTSSFLITALANIYVSRINEQTPNSRTLEAVNLSFKPFASHSPTLNFPAWHPYISSFLSGSFVMLKPSNTGDLFTIVGHFLNETQNKSFYSEQSELDNQRLS